jgi:hypothetical protein
MAASCSKRDSIVHLPVFKVAAPPFTLIALLTQYSKGGE